MNTQPAPPPRGQSDSATGTIATNAGNRVTFQGAQTWRESLLAGGSLATLIALLFSISLLLFFGWRVGVLQEELLDYLDKTLSISKINYNPILGVYSINDTELHILEQLKTYKTLLSCFLFSDLILLAIFVAALFLYFTTDVSQSPTRLIFYILLGLGIVAAIVEVHTLVFLLLPYSSSMPKATEGLLNHAIPHNPGGLLQMESRLSCTFDYNLYAVDRRRNNPKNTCDPRILSSFLPSAFLIFLLVIRLLPFVLLVLLAVKRTPFSESIAQQIEKLRCSSPGSSKRFQEA